jgi:hypothetical protein
MAVVCGLQRQLSVRLQASLWAFALADRSGRVFATAVNLWRGPQ